MIIICPQCATKFELEQRSIPGKGVKARCSKCRHIFELPPAPAPGPAAESPQPFKKSLASRRSHRISGIAAVAVGVIAAAGLVVAAGGVWKTPLAKKAEELFSKGERHPGPSGEKEGAFVLQNVKGYFVENSHLNKVFIIEGQAINQMKEPRSFLRVRGTLLDERGAKVEEKMVYCGNILDEKDLKQMDREAIAKSLSSQFGESLSNLNIDPNQAVPFMIVFTDLPPSPPGNGTASSSAKPGGTAASDFLVEVVDSQTGSK
jgi:predicted Zn finger-like uncharacterized protein